MSTLRQTLILANHRGFESDESMSDGSEGVRQHDLSVECRSLMARTGVDGHGDVVIGRGAATESDSSSSFTSAKSTSNSVIDILNRQLELAEQRRQADLKAAEERADQRRREDLKTAEDNRRHELKAAEDNRRHELKAVEDRARLDLEAAEMRHQVALDRAEKRSKTAEDNRRHELKAVEDRARLDLEAAEMRHQVALDRAEKRSQDALERAEQRWQHERMAMQEDLIAALQKIQHLQLVNNFTNSSNQNSAATLSMADNFSPTRNVYSN